ncbi:c-type cytochrome [Caballeronia sp. LjRoot29]|uniref:c-type cytochrome n=1 Tax=Caballeronia sp. LjRoot29 TaxID=3342315 RepID=UPI003ED04105
MKRSIGLAALLSALLCAAFFAVTLGSLAHPHFTSTANAAETSPLSLTDTTLLKHGANLAAIGDCVVCHTANRSAPFAGGRPLDTPFGTIYSTNITPDRTTGIGGWTLGDFTRSMRRGVARDGHLLYPAFPYPHFTHMTDTDIAALYAFLMSRDAVQSTAPANRLIFPLSIRPLMAAWNLFFLHPGVEADGEADVQAPAETATHGAQLIRGKYLIDGPAHCAACHTPMNLLGAEKRGDAFDGNVIEGWEAPALTTLLSAPEPWTRDQLSTYLRTGFANQHGAAAGPMRAVTQSLTNASDADIDAMAAYLLSLQKPAEASPKATQQAAEANTSNIHNGAVLFSAACASCHATNAPMTTLGSRPSLALGTAVNAHDPRNALRMILDGIPTDRSTRAAFMPGFADTFTNAQIADLAAYLRSNFSSQPAWTLDEADIERLRKESHEP